MAIKLEDKNNNVPGLKFWLITNQLKVILNLTWGSDEHFLNKNWFPEKKNPLSTIEYLNIDEPEDDQTRIFRQENSWDNATHLDSCSVAEMSGKWTWNLILLFN